MTMNEMPTALDSDHDLAKALNEADAPRHGEQSAGEWVKANLFSNVFNSIITIVFGVIGAYLAFRAGKFVFATARWEPIRANLELFMIGLFSRSERTRIVVQLLMMSGAVGLLVGWMRERSIRTAEQAGLAVPKTTLREYWGTYWAAVAFVGFAMVIGVRTINPWLLLIGCAIAAVTGFAVNARNLPTAAKVIVLVPFALAGGVLTRVPDLNNQGAYTIAIVASIGLAAVAFTQRPSVTLSVGLLFGVAAFQVLSGTGGLAWVYLTAALIPLSNDLVGAASERAPAAAGWVGTAVVAAGGALLVSLGGVGLDPGTLIPIGVFAIAGVCAAAALRDDPGPGLRFGALAVLGVITWRLGRLIGHEGIDWEDWGGLHLNLVVAAAVTSLAFPVGLLLALGRRSSLPVLRGLCTVYIEMIRGVPLITLLFMAQLFVGFFVNGNNLPLQTKAIIVFTMFSSAYIAEIVRGGLQAVAKGQTEAGQAMGMSPAAITRLLILPQALKAVIPAMVGQFISLFKDTSLLTFIGIIEFLGVREIVFSQEAFRGFGIAETLVFVAFGYWAVSFTMSRESQRLERRLDTGNR